MELSKRSIKKIEEIIDGATRQFNLYGFNKTTIDGIAAATGVSKVTIYKYFSNKQVLYEHILKQIYLVEFNAIEEIIESELPFKEKIDHIIDVRVRKYDDDNILKVDPNYIFSSELRAFNKEHTSKMGLLNNKLYEQGKQEGLIRLDFSNELMDLYFKVIRSGLRDNYSSISVQSKEHLSKLLEILYAGVIGCPVVAPKKETE